MIMAFCSNCGTQIGDGAKFCSSCGTPAGGGASASSAPAAPAAEKVGNIRKCPACGAEVSAMAAVCSSCGHEFSNVQIANSLQAFFEKIDAIDQEVYAKESEKGTLSSVLGGLGKLYGVSDWGGSTGGKRKVALIEGYPIPNSKEDIIEFIVLATSKLTGIKTTTMGRKLPASMMKDEHLLESAWKVKCEQAYNKAKLSFGSDKDAIANIESILKQKKIIK
ncbi:MAG: zinc-ribbon domain-containing protein [Spirochaetales bacterium]|jgi:hypothetical protein|nr:zinc-ribbon domain-containing protein [Spirochaetales bacterium]